MIYDPMNASSVTNLWHVCDLLVATDSVTGFSFENSALASLLTIVASIAGTWTADANPSVTICHKVRNKYSVLVKLAENMHGKLEVTTTAAAVEIV